MKFLIVCLLLGIYQVLASVNVDVGSSGSVSQASNEQPSFDEMGVVYNSGNSFSYIYAICDDSSYSSGDQNYQLSYSQTFAQIQCNEMGILATYQSMFPSVVHLFKIENGVKKGDAIGTYFYGPTFGPYKIWDGILERKDAKGQTFKNITSEITSPCDGTLDSTVGFTAVGSGSHLSITCKDGKNLFFNLPQAGEISTKLGKESVTKGQNIGLFFTFNEKKPEWGETPYIEPTPPGPSFDSRYVHAPCKQMALFTPSEDYSKVQPEKDLYSILCGVSYKISAVSSQKLSVTKVSQWSLFLQNQQVLILTPNNM